MQKVLNHMPTLEKCRDIIEVLTVKRMIEISNGDQIMGDQLKRTLSNKRIDDIEIEDLLTVGQLSAQLAEWLMQKDPSVIAHAIQLSYATDMPLDE